MGEAHGELMAAIRSSLAAHADRERAAGQQAYMKRALPFLGVRVPMVRSITHAACKHNPCTSQAQFRATVVTLFAGAEYQEHRYAAVSIGTFKGHRGYQTPAVFPAYKRLIVEAAWWDITDELSHLFGAMLITYPEETRSLLRRWATHYNIWLRRTAIISQLGLKANVDQRFLFDCIAPSLGRPEFFLRKAIGWALRDLAKTAPQATRSYVESHESQLSPLSKREALKNL